MKHHFLLSLALSITLSSRIASCSEMNSQVRDALNSWFNRKTLITGTALISLAAVSVALYKAFNKFNQFLAQWNINLKDLARWDINRLFPPKDEWKKTIIMDLQEITPQEMQEINNIEYTLKSRHWSRKAIKDIRKNQLYQQEPYKKFIDDMLINHYYHQIYTVLQSIPLRKRPEWVEDYKEILLTSKELEEGKEGTKYQALEKLKKHTENFITIPYHKPSQSNIPLQLSQ